MKAMILAAGLGERMRPLTDHTPKPLLEVKGKSLIDYHLDALVNAGISEVVINIAYLGHKIRESLESRHNSSLHIYFSEEPEPLETGGALVYAADLLGDQPFLLINGDIFTDYSFSKIVQRSLPEAAHLVLVPNPEFHPKGDFVINSEGRILPDADEPRFTFAGISLIHPQLIQDYPNKRRKFPLAEALRYAIGQGQVTGEIFRGTWSDVGTPERLALLQ